MPTANTTHRAADPALQTERDREAFDFARTIWLQISLATKMACGARDAAAGSDDQGNRAKLTFRVTISRGQFHKIVVRYTHADLYDVELWHIARKTHECTMIESSDGIYADMLSEVIYRFCNK